MNDSFANPQPPSNYSHPHYKEDLQPMTNDDFRKLLMTPSVASSVREKVPMSTRVEISSSKKKVDDARKERKLYYASLMKEAKEREKELALKYRDRAKERRENDKIAETPNANDFVSTTANFRAVAPDFSLTDNALRRRQIIEESKYLGGDLEHTHLVKGLDYALLQKIKAETEKTEVDHEDDEEKPQMDQANTEEQKEDNEKSDDEEKLTDEKVKANLKPKLFSKNANAALAAALNKSLTDQPFAFKKQLESVKAHKSSKSKNSIDKKKIEELDDDEEDDENKINFKTKLGRNIYRVLFEAEAPKRNELFLPHRMAYIVELNEDETDVPITSIRSKADCPNNENNTTLTTNDIVINKLTQILSYLRHGKRDAKKLKKKLVSKNEEIETNKSGLNANIGIYDEIGDYVPDLTKKDQKKDTSIKPSTIKDESQKKSRNYFGNEESVKKESTSSNVISKEAATEFIKHVSEKYAAKEAAAKKEERKSGMLVKFDSDSYAECYPGTKAEEDVNIDSDEETDFTKMDQGNKKGPVNRWDFDTNEEYNDYMSNREAMPKAAFQYGLKMTEGRKTRRLPGDGKNEKAKLDKEWTQISKIIDKRKTGDFNSSQYKKPKY